MSDTSTSTARFDPMDRGLVGDYTRRQIVTISIGVTAWFACWISDKGMLVGLVPLLVCGVLGFRWPGGREALVDWIPVWVGYLFHGGSRRHWWRPVHLVTAEAVEESPVLPDWLSGLQIVSHPTDGWAAVHDATNKTLTAHLQIAGRGFATLPPDAQELLVSGWGSVFGAVAPEDGLVRITWSDMARRQTLDGHDAWAAGQGTDTDQRRIYREFAASKQPPHHDLIVTVSVATASTRSAAGQEQAMDQLTSAVRIVRDALVEAQLEAHGPLQAGEISYLMRVSLDPTGVETPAGQRSGSLVHRLGLVPIGDAGPMRATPWANRTLVDGVLHRSFWVASWPDNPQNIEWFEGVLGGDLAEGDEDSMTAAEPTQRIFTFIAEPMDHDRAVAELGRDASRHGGEQVAAQEGRARWDGFKRRKSEAVLAREQEVVAGYTPVAYTALVDVMVAEEDGDLHRVARAVQRQYRRRGVRLRQLWGRNELGVASAMPLGLGLTREPF